MAEASVHANWRQYSRFYRDRATWEAVADVVLQPGVTWTSAGDHPVDRVTAVLALRIEF